MNSHNRRKSLKSIVTVGAVVASMPKDWSKPVVEAVILPSHAQVTPVTTSPPTITTTAAPGPTGGNPITGVVGNMAPSRQLFGSLDGQCIQIEPAPGGRGYEEGEQVIITVGPGCQGMATLGANSDGALTLSGSVVLSSLGRNCRPSPTSIDMTFDLAVPPTTAGGTVDGSRTDMSGGTCPVFVCEAPYFIRGSFGGEVSGPVSASGNSLVINEGIDDLMLVFGDNYGFSGATVTTSPNQNTTVSPSSPNGETEVGVIMTNIGFQPFTGTVMLENGCGEITTFNIVVTGFPSQEL